MADYNPEEDDPNYYKYKDEVESWVDYVCELIGINWKHRNFLHQLLTWLVADIYKMGYENGNRDRENKIIN